jgi:hypothetical protein
LEWVKYLATLAERHRFWLATKEMVYDRLNDYQDIRFRVEADGAISVHNPTDRQISRLMVRTSSPIAAVTIDGCTQLCTHVSSDNTVTLPPIAPGHTLGLRPTGDINGVPMLNQSNTKHLTVVSALHDREVGTTRLELSAVGRNNVRFANLDPGASYRVTTGGIHSRSWDQRADAPGIELATLMECAGPAQPALEGEILDHGPGVPPEMIDRIFDPYCTGKAGGTGLGLALVKQTIEMHGGSIALQETPGGGATFVVRMAAP